MLQHLKIKHQRIYESAILLKNDPVDPVTMNLSLLYGTTTITRSAIESKYFKRLLGNDVPCMRTIVNQMDIEAAKVVKMITEELTTSSVVHLCLDIWTMKNCQNSYITVNAHYFKDTQKVSTCLGVEPIVSHTAANTKFLVDRILEAYAIDETKIGYIITDNAASMKKAFKDYSKMEFDIIDEEDDGFVDENYSDYLEKIYGKKWVGCLVHSLQLVLRYVLLYQILSL